MSKYQRCNQVVFVTGLIGVLFTMPANAASCALVSGYKNNFTCISQGSQSIGAIKGEKRWRFNNICDYGIAVNVQTDAGVDGIWVPARGSASSLCIDSLKCHFFISYDVPCTK